MLDREKDIRGQALLKSIWESGLAPKEVAFAKEWVEKMFDFSLKLIEKYAKIETPAPQLPLNAPESFSRPVLGSPAGPGGSSSSKDWPPQESDSKLADIIVGITVITEKEYKPKKFRYGIKDSKGTWYSTFFKQHYLNAQECKNEGKQARILYEVGEYNGKPQYTIQSLDVM